MHEELWDRLGKLDGQETSKRAKCEYLPDESWYLINFLNTEFKVNILENKIERSCDSAPAQYLDQLCILIYLLNAKNIPLYNKLVTPESLAGGQFFFRGPHTLPAKELANYFGSEPQLLYEAAKSLNAEQRTLGDASIELSILPRVPITIVLWAGDDEFEPRASILVDQSAGEQLLLDALWVAIKLAVTSLTKAVAKQK